MIQELNTNYSRTELTGHIDKFANANVLVIGDIILDEYLWGDVSRISPEAPVPVVEISKETKMLGGAANVVNNINSLGGKVSLCGVIGDDATGCEILEIMQNSGLNIDGIATESQRCTSIKSRIIAHNQQVVRFDRETQKELDPATIKKLINFIKAKKDKLDAIVVEDYGKGVISGSLMKKLREVVSDSDIFLAVDPKENNFEHYKGVDILTPNQSEAGAFCRFKIVDEKTLIDAGNRMMDKLNSHSVLITQGKDGMTLFERDKEPYHIPTIAKKVFDVSGAGDTVISTLCLGMATGLDLKTAALISNFAAGIVVGEVGTSVVRVDELKKVILSDRS
jgi:D-beta-D-heptose 7-phosphate kinase/D-beta-D-heptose 1-phosphate adenosyltransferase